MVLGLALVLSLALVFLPLFVALLGVQLALLAQLARLALLTRLRLRLLLMRHPRRDLLLLLLLGPQLVRQNQINLLSFY